MKTIELIGHVDEPHRLSADVPAGVPPGPVKVILQVDEGEDDEGAWARGIAQAWAADWSDPREDIYSVQDGKPADEPR